MIKMHSADKIVCCHYWLLLLIGLDFSFFNQKKKKKKKSSICHPDKKNAINLSTNNSKIRWEFIKITKIINVYKVFIFYINVVLI